MWIIILFALLVYKRYGTVLGPINGALLTSTINVVNLELLEAGGGGAVLSLHGCCSLLCGALLGGGSVFRGLVAADP